MGAERKGFWTIAGHWPGIASILFGIVLRTVLARYMFLQADEEVFSYDAYYFLLGRPLDFIVGKIGAYLFYPLALAGWFKLLGVSFFISRLFTVLCWGFILCIFYITLFKVLNNQKWAFIGTLLLAVLPFPLRYGHVALSEPFAWVFISLSLLLLIRGINRDRWPYLFASGALVSMAFFARRSALVLPIFLAPGLVWMNRGSLKRGLSQTISFIIGFCAPLFAGLGTFVALFGWKDLTEMGFLWVPNITSEWSLDLSNASSYDSALYVLQPTIWKSLPLMIGLLSATVILLMSLHRNRWRVVYLSSFLWPAFIRMTFDGEVGAGSVFLLSVLPLLPLLPCLVRTDRQEVGTSVSLLLGSAYAFATTTLSMDIWNVILYCGVGAVFLIYLDDRMQSDLGSFILMGAGLLLLTLICVREPQIEGLLSRSVPVTTMVLFLVMASFQGPNVRMVQKVTGLVLLQSILSVRYAMAFVLPFLVLFPIIALLWLESRKPSIWKRTRYVTAFGALPFLSLMPHEVHLPILLTCTSIPLVLIASSVLPMKELLFIPLWALSIAVSMAMIHQSSDSLLLSIMAGALVGSASAIGRGSSGLSTLWKHRIAERTSVVLFLMIVSYLAFYIYYAWTEVYLMEFIVPSVMLMSLLIYVMFGPSLRISNPATVSRGRSRVKTIGLQKGSSALSAAMLILAVPVSIGAFLEDDWFEEEPMDQRPYMRTIVEIGEWLRDHTKEGEKVLAWHCYAVEADRETIIDVSNAARYDAREVMSDMEAMHVNTFVRCYYTDHGIWKDQPVFQDYIRGNFTLDRVIDGNECWLRNVR